MPRSRVIKSILCLAAAPAMLAVLAAVSVARGGVVVHQLGQQDFAPGAGPLAVSQLQSAGAAEAYPFDGTIFGDDRRPSGFGEITFAYSFAPPATPLDGTLTLGLMGLDSAPGRRPTVRLFLDDVEQPNAPFAGMSSALFRSSASVVNVPVPATLLADGQLTVTVRAFRSSPGFAGNAIEADFATLAVADGKAPSGGGGPDDGGAGKPGDGDGTSGGEGNSPGGGGGGNGAGHPGPPLAVPLPPAVLTGMVGLAVARLARRRLKR
jgi:hypothetical protein